MKRVLAPATVATLIAMLLMPAGVAAAAPPANDLPAGAIVLAATLPQTIAQDTTEATVTTDDVGCGAGGLDLASVWYRMTPSSDLRIVMDPNASGYLVGINVFAGTADGAGLFACFQGVGVVDLAAGTTYFFMFADTDGDATNGGSLSVGLDVAPPALELSLTVNPKGSISAKIGEASISGTITCNHAADFAGLDIELRQAIGRFTIHGFSFADAECGPTPSAWKATISGENGKFAGGKATANVSVFACDAFSCDDDFVTAAVRLGK